MKRKLSHFQELYQENLQESMSTISCPQQKPPPPPQPQQPTIASRTTSSSSFNDISQEDQTTPETNATLLSNPQTVQMANPSWPRKSPGIPLQPIQPSHAPPRIFPQSQEIEHECAMAITPRTTLPTRWSFIAWPARMPLPTATVPAPLPPERPPPSLFENTSFSLRPPVMRPLSPTPQLQPHQVPLQLGSRSQQIMLLPPAPPPSDAGLFINHSQPIDHDQAIIPPYPWATTSRASVHNIGFLLYQDMIMISGLMQCKLCSEIYETKYDLLKKFDEVAFIAMKRKKKKYETAPFAWWHPRLQDCSCCKKEKCVKPMLGKKRSINWLFLLLGQWIGCCSPKYLRYFCKHNGYNQNVCKGRLVLQTYIGICQQLLPEVHFDSEIKLSSDS